MAASQYSFTPFVDRSRHWQCLEQLVRSGFLPEVTADQLTYRLQRLKSRFHLHSHDTDELAQELLLELVRSRARHDEQRVPLPRFLKAILNKSYCQICRRIRKECGKRRKTVPLHESQAIDHRVTLAESQLEVIERLGGESALLFDLARMSPARAAQMEGAHRGTVFRRITALRELARQSLQQQSAER